MIRDKDMNSGRSAYREKDGRPDNAIKLRAEASLKEPTLFKIGFTT